MHGTFATGGSDGGVNLWDGANKKRLAALPQFPTSVAALAFNADGSKLAVASSSRGRAGTSAGRRSRRRAARAGALRGVDARYRRRAERIGFARHLPPSRRGDWLRAVSTRGIAGPRRRRYCFEEGEKDHPKDELYIHSTLPHEVTPKTSSAAPP